MNTNQTIEEKRKFYSDFYKVGNSMFRQKKQLEKIKWETIDVDSLIKSIDGIRESDSKHALEFGIYDVIRILNLQESNKPGYDAVRKNETGDEKVQIKSSIIHPSYREEDKLDSFQFRKSWDKVVLIIYNKEFKPEKIYEASKEQIKRSMREAGPDISSLPISSFTSIAKLVWVKKK